MKPIVDSLKVLGESTKMFESLRDNLFAPKGLKFNSQICTTKEQSERLLALGLKKETADMHHSYYTRVSFDGSKSHFWKEETGCSEKAIPAWSLHRLMCLVFNSGGTHVELFEDDDAYEILIYKIEMRIKEGYFNEEYLEEKK